MSIIINECNKRMDKTVFHKYIPYSLFAFVFSYSIHKSFLLAFIHCIFGFWYCVYWICAYSAIPTMIIEWING